MTKEEQRQFQLDLIKSWIDAGMDAQEAVDLFNEVEAE